MIAFVSDIRMIADYWLRPGNTAASTNYLSFLEDTLENLAGKRVGLIRMDSGFFTKEILDYLEQKGLEYIVACRFTWPIKRELVGGKAWLKWPTASRWRKPSIRPKVGLHREGL